jgi:Flp pilus assembly protein TadD
MTTITKSTLLLLVVLLVSSCNQPDRVLLGEGPYVRQFSRAKAAFEKGEYDQAIAIYTEIVQLAPDNALAYAKRGYAYYRC